MKQFIIKQNDASQRLDQFLKKAAPNLPQALLYKALRKKLIKVNRKRAEGSSRLQTGDVVECWLPDDLFAASPWQYDFLQAGRQLSVLYEDDRLLLLNKPQGLLSHPGEGEYGDTLLGRVQRYLYEKQEYNPAQENAFAPALCNRIDRNTQGIVIAAKTAAALRDVNEQIKFRQARKFYLCAVHGQLQDHNDWVLLKSYMIKDESKALVRVYDLPRPGAKECLTRYRVLARAGALSLLEAELLTGRTHQLRAQFSHIGHALVGDGKYAPRAQYQRDKANGYAQQCLCSWRLVLGELDVRVPQVDFVERLFAGIDK